MDLNFLHFKSGLFNDSTKHEIDFRIEGIQSFLHGAEICILLNIGISQEFPIGIGISENLHQDFYVLLGLTAPWLVKNLVQIVVEWLYLMVKITVFRTIQEGVLVNELI